MKAEAPTDTALPPPTPKVGAAPPTGPAPAARHAPAAGAAPASVHRRWATCKCFYTKINQ